MIKKEGKTNKLAKLMLQDEMRMREGGLQQPGGTDWTGWAKVPTLPSYLTLPYHAMPAEEQQVQQCSSDVAPPAPASLMSLTSFWLAVRFFQALNFPRLQS